MGVQNRLLPFVPIEANRKAVHDTVSRHSLFFTNVPGPVEGLYMGGSGYSIKGVHACITNLLPQVSAVSYNGKVSMTMVVDDVAIPEVRGMVGYFSNALSSLAEGYNISTCSTQQQHS